MFGAALVLLAASLWATFGLFAKVLFAAGFEPLELASVRTSIGFLAVLLVAAPRLLRTHERGGVRVPRRALLLFTAYGVFGFAVFELVFFAALERTTVSIAVALLYTAPAFVVIISALVWHERVGAHRLVALALVLAGVLLVTGAASPVFRGDASLSPAALLLGLGSGVGYAAYTLFSKLATERYGPLASLFWSFGFAAAVLAVIAPPIAPFLRIPGHALLLIALSIVPTVLPYALFLVAL
ncbi:MAG: DMT family transporter, partial [Gemmatimonadota bacterium]